MKIYSSSRSYIYPFPFKDIYIYIFKEIYLYLPILGRIKPEETSQTEKTKHCNDITYLWNLGKPNWLNRRVDGGYGGLGRRGVGEVLVKGYELAVRR